MNSVAPGVIPFAEKDDPRIVAMAAGTPACCAGTGDEIADAVVYFLKATNFVTGQVLQVDGGLGLKKDMRPTSITGDSLRERAAKRSGDKDTARVRAGVEASNAAEAGRRLAALGGTEPKLRPIPRRRDQA